MSVKPPESADILTELALEVFRLNSALIALGDAIAADLGLSSARWQVMGAITLAGRPQPVAQIARRMGLTRQAVQRVVNDLTASGLVVLQDNPAHRRAKCVALTAKGRDAYQAAASRWTPLARTLAAPHAPRALTDAARLARRLRTDIAQWQTNDQAKYRSSTPR